MATTIGEALLKLGIDDKAFRKGMTKAQKATERFGQGMTSVGKNLSASVTLPLLAFGATALKVGGDFEQAMNQVAAVSGATGEQLTQLRDQAKELGATTQFSASQAAEGMGFLAQAGFEANDIMSAMPKTLELAAAAQMDLGQTADVVSNILAGYRLETEDLGRVNDVLVKAFTSSNTNLQQLGEAMKFAGPVASAAGVGFEEAAAALGLMGNAGIQASMAGTSLRGAISRILAPTKKAKGIMKDMGLNFTDAKGRLVPLTEIIRQLGPHADNAGLFMELFGQRAGPAMATLAAQGSDALSKFTTELKNSGGTSARIAAVQMEGLNGALRELKSAFEGLLIALAESGMIDLVADFARQLSGIIRGLSQSNPELLKMATVVGAVAAAAGPALIILGQMVISFSALMPVMTALLPVLGALKVAVLAIVSPAGAIALLGVAVIMWIDNWEELRDGTIVIVNFLREQIPLKFEELKNDLKVIIEFMGEMVPRVLKAGWSKVTKFTSDLKDDVLFIWKEVSDRLVGNSIVPDMSVMIQREFKKLKTNVVADSDATATGVTGSYQKMALGTKFNLDTIANQVFPGFAAKIGGQMGGLKTNIVAQTNQTALGTNNAFASMTTGIGGKLNQIKGFVKPFNAETKQDFMNLRTSVIASTTAMGKKVGVNFGALGTSAIASMGNVTAQLIKGEKSFSQFADVAVKALLKVAAQQAAMAAFGPLGGIGASVFSGFFAEGGFIPPGSFGVVGEAGPELAFGGRSGLTIQPNAATAGAGGGSMSVNVNVTGMDLGSEDAARKLATTLTQSVKRGARELLEFSRASGDRNSLNNNRAA